MKIVSMTIIDQSRNACLTAAVAFLATFTRPVDVSAVQAEDVVAKTPKEDTAPAEDPAEVQRREQIKQQATHWEQQFTKLLYGDLELIRSLVGDIPRDARRAIARDGERAVKEAAVRLAELQFGGARRRAEAGDAGVAIGGLGNLIVAGGKIIVRGGLGSGRPDDAKASDDPTALVSKALSKSLAAHVGSEQASGYDRQVVARDERRRASAVHEIVAVLDGELFLTSQQRSQIERSLLERWDESMTVALEGMHWADDRRVFPGLPVECIRPHLTEAQRKQFTAQGNGGAVVAPQRRVWVRMNVLSNVHATPRDPWWFE